MTAADRAILAPAHEPRSRWAPRIIGTIVVLAAVAATGFGVAAAIGRVSIVGDRTTTVTHGDPVQQVLEARLLCGAEVHTQWEMTSSDTVENLPDVLVGRSLTGVVHAGALACSQAAPDVTRQADGTVLVTLAPPSIAYSWIDPSEMRPPHQDRGLWDRVSDTWDSAFGDGGNGVDAYHGFLSDADEAVLEQIAETDALDVAEEQIRAVVIALAQAAAPGTVVDVHFGAASSTPVRATGTADREEAS